MNNSQPLIQVSEVIKKSDQGITRPFICRDDSGRQLWVKGAELSKPELAAEWISACLAKEWGLPIAPFGLVYIDPLLIEYSSMPEISSLGSGIGFGSYHVEGAVELDYPESLKIDSELRADILLFDYWIQNEDRTLGENGGNPNLLLHIPEGDVVIIDHNLAFDVSFAKETLFGTHVFRDFRQKWTGEYIKTHQKKLLDI
ncbi:hypothetical protein EGM51_14045 [Verrucomicrobia bacterium S94]|nr:hypothetical protein EGM51_14045 [Verrucomicrobia bacterium S94]